MREKPKKNHQQRTDGITNFVDPLRSAPLPSPHPCQQFHFLHKGIGYFSQCYGITHLGGDAVASAKLGLRVTPLRNRVHRPENPGFWLAVLLKPIVYTIVTLQNDPPLHTIPPNAHPYSSSAFVCGGTTHLLRARVKKSLEDLLQLVSILRSCRS